MRNSPETYEDFLRRIPVHVARELGVFAAAFSHTCQLPPEQVELVVRRGPGDEWIFYYRKRGPRKGELTSWEK